MPFKIKKANLTKNIFRVKLENISSESEAKDLLKKSVYINELENQDNTIILLTTLMFTITMNI